ncbi:MAG: metal ABC transporter ATP-binding protein [Spirochaetales bacterium]|nr:metal ABC transporter ATP-binding protein [Spirochaetales bacterium]
MKQDASKALIEVEGLSFAYNNEPVIEDAGFSIMRNDVITVIGPNGGGKTTLLKLLMGRLKPQKGRITINSVKSGVFGYVPQYSNLDSSYPITVFEVVLSGRIRNFGFYSRGDRIAAAKSLSAVGLANIEDRSFFELSGGQRQRILIARALAADPEILLLDEPTASIDADAEKHLNGLLMKLSLDHTIILVTHDLGFVNEFTNRVLCVNRTVREHPVDELDDQVITAAYGSRMKVVRHDHDLPEHRAGGV